MNIGKSCPDRSPREYSVSGYGYTEFRTLEGGTMKKIYITVLYVALTLAALIVAAGAPIPWSGSGGGGGTGITGLGGFGF